MDSYNAGNEVLPSCWTRYDNYDQGVKCQLSNSFSFSNSNSLLMACGTDAIGEHYSLLIGPILSNPEAASHLFLMTYSSNPDTRIEVGYCTGNAHNSPFVPLDTIAADETQTWIRHYSEINLPELPECRLALRMLRSLQPSNNCIIYIDDLQLTSCAADSLEAHMQGAYSIELTWHEYGNPSVNCEIGPAGFVPGTGTLYEDVESPLNVNNLTPNTPYEFVLSTSCVEQQQATSTSLQVTTMPLNEVELPFCLNFESTNNLNGCLWFGRFEPSRESQYRHNGTYSLKLYACDNEQRRGLIVLPRIATDSIKKTTARLWLRSGRAELVRLEVGAMTLPGVQSTFVPVDTLTCSQSDTWEYFQVPLSSYTDTGHYLAFRGIGQDISSFLYIDDLVLTENAISNLTVESVGGHEIGLEWESITGMWNCDSIVIKYESAGISGETTVAYDETATANSNRRGYTIQGLERSTQYTISVYAQCDSSNQCSWLQTTATTTDIVDQLPYCRSFYGISSLPSGWSIAASGVNMERVPDYNNNQDRAIRLSYGGMVVLPSTNLEDLTSGTTQLQVSFWALSTSPNDLVVGLLEDPDNPAAFIPYDTIELQANQWANRHVSIPYIENSHIAFKNKINFIYIDAIRIDTLSLSGFRCATTSSVSALLRWDTTSLGADSVTLEYGAGFFTPGNGSHTLRCSGGEVLLQELANNTTYIAYLYSDYGNCPSRPVRFTTLEHGSLLPLCEDFSGVAYGSLPDGWIAAQRSNSLPAVQTGELHLFGFGNTCSMVVLPFIEEPTWQQSTLRFSIYGSGMLIIGMSSEPLDPEAFEPIDTITVNNYYETINATVEFSSYTGTGRNICLLTPGGSSRHCYVDNLTISRCNLADVTIRRINTSEASFRLNYLGNADSLLFEYMIDGGEWNSLHLPLTTDFESTNARVEYVATGLSDITIKTLSPNSRYHYRITLICDDTTEACGHQNGDFLTLNSTLGVGYCQNFDGYSNTQRVPSNWHVIQEYDNYPRIQNHSGQSNGDLCLMMRSQGNNQTFLSTHLCDSFPSIDTVWLSFDLQVLSSPNQETFLEIGYLTTLGDISTFHILDTLRPTVENNNYTIAIPASLIGGNHIGLKYNDNGGRICSIDNFSVSKCKVKDVTVSNLLHDRIQLMWNKTHPTDTIFLSCSPESSNDASTLLLQSVHDSTTITGLSPSTSYRISLWSSCQDTSDYCQATTLTVNTLHEPIHTQLCEDFESIPINGLPIGWMRPLGGSSPLVTNSAARSGTNSLLFQASSSSSCMAVLPIISVDDISQLHLSFYTRGVSGNYKLRVGIMTNPYDTATFTQLAEYNYSNYWSDIVVNFSTYQGDGRFISFLVTSNNSSSLIIDDIQIYKCLLTQASAYPLSETSIGLSWESDPPNAGLMIEYKAVDEEGADFEPGTGQFAEGIGGFMEIDSLLPATHYSFVCYALCGDSQFCMSQHLSTQTLHPPINIPHCENFDAFEHLNFPDSWRKIGCSGTAASYAVNNPHGSGKCIVMPGNCYITTPRFYASNSCSNDSLVIRFLSCAPENIPGSLVVGYFNGTVTPDNFVPLDTIIETITEVWHPHTLVVHYHGTFDSPIAFKAISTASGSYRHYIDNLCVQQCLVQEVTMENRTDSSVSFSWSGIGVDTLWCVYSTSDGEGQEQVIGTPFSPLYINGLTAGSEYSFNFLSSCSCRAEGGIVVGDAVQQSNSQNIVTLNITTSIPLCEDFEDVATNHLPQYWHRESSMDSQFPLVNIHNSHTGSRCLEFYCNAGSYSYAVLPRIALSSIRKSLISYYAFSSSNLAVNSSCFSVGVMSDPASPNTFVEVAQPSLTATGEWQQMTADFSSYSGDGEYIAFRFTPTSSPYYYYIDDILLDSCIVIGLQSMKQGESLLFSWNLVCSDATNPTHQVLFQLTAENNMLIDTILTNTDSMRVAALPDDSFCSVKVSPLSAGGCASALMEFRPISIELPYCEDFSTYPIDNQIPGWTTIRNFYPSSIVYPIVSQASATSQNLQFKAMNTSNYTAVVLPPLAGNASLEDKWVFLRLSTSYSNYSYARFELGYLSNGTTGSYYSLCNPLQVYTYSGWDHTVHLHSSQPDVGSRLVLKAFTSEARQCDIYVDKLQIFNHRPPTNVYCNIIDSRHCRVYWGDDNPNYILHYSDGTDTLTDTSTMNEVILSNLRPMTTYTVNFTAPDGEEYCGISKSFNTPDEQAIPYCQNFDNTPAGSWPEGWGRVYYGGSNDTRPTIRSSVGVNGSKALTVSDNNAHKVLLPYLGTDDMRKLYLSCDMKCSFPNNMFYQVCCEAGNTMTVIDTLRCTVGGEWQRRCISLSRFPATGGRIALILCSNVTGSPLIIDNLKVSTDPEINVDNITWNSVDVIPLAPINQYPLYLDICMTDMSSQSTRYIIDTLPFTIQGLEPGKMYDLRLLSDTNATICGEPISFNTAYCMSFPYCNDLEGLTSYPSQWISQGHTYKPSISTISSFALSGYLSLCFQCRSNYRNMAILPLPRTVDSRSLSGSLWMRTQNHSSTMIVVGVISDPEDMNTFFPCDTLRCTASNSYQQFHFTFNNYNLSGGYPAIISVGSNNTTYSIYIDDLEFSDISHASFSLFGATSVLCDVTTDAEHHWIGYRQINPDTSNTRFIESSSPMTVIPGLASDCQYVFYATSDTNQIPCGSYDTVQTWHAVTIPYCSDVAELCQSCQQYHDKGFIIGEWNHSEGEEAYLSLRFRASMFDTLVIGLTENLTDTATIYVVDSISGRYPMERWQRCLIRLSSVPASFRFLHIHSLSSSNNQSFQGMIDDLRLLDCAIPMVERHSATAFSLFSPYESDFWFSLQPSSSNTPSPLHLNAGERLVFDSLEPLSEYSITLSCDSAGENCNYTTTYSTGTIVSLPYCEDFSSYATSPSFFPDGWSRNQTNQEYNRIYSSQGNVLRLYGANNGPNYACLPDLNTDDVRNANVSFRALTDYYHTVKLVVGVMDDPTDIATLNAADTVLFSTNNSWQWFHIRLDSVGSLRNSRNIAFRMLNDYVRLCYVHIDDIEINSCHRADRDEARLVGYNLVEVDNSSDRGRGLWLEYGDEGFPQGTGAWVWLDSLPYTIEMESNTTYDFYLHCDSGTSTCRAPIRMRTLPEPRAIPFCETFESQNSYADFRLIPTTTTVSVAAPSSVNDPAMRIYRGRNDPNAYIILPTVEVDSLEDFAVSFKMQSSRFIVVDIGYLTDGNDTNSFVVWDSYGVSNYWLYTSFMKSDLPPEARFLAIRVQSSTSGYSYFYLDNLHYGNCGVNNFQIVDIASNAVTIDWHQIGEPNVTVSYRKEGTPSYETTQIHTLQHPLTIDSLDRFHKYIITLSSTCDLETPCEATYEKTLTFFTPAGSPGCIDATNLNANYTACHTGSYSNPFETIAVYDYGYANPNSRHTIHFDTTERDANTGYNLRTVPPGADASVRLGNSNTSNSGSYAYGEAITYAFFVDTASADLLLLRYAAVLQDYGHPTSTQPRFSLELLDEDGNLLDAECYSANFVANENLGWNIEGNILWKDWTDVGVDISPYANQTIFIRLVTRDCAEGTHFGYAYFTLECMKKHLVAEMCGVTDSNTFTAPSGFAYKWHKHNQSTILSTERSITVAYDSATYLCECSFLDNPSCNFTLSAYAGSRFPLANFSYTTEIKDCKIHVTFNNNSTISADGVNPLPGGEPCESAKWDFGNGESSDNYHATAVYTSGTYLVRLISSIADGQCSDTAYATLVLSLNPENYYITGSDFICDGDTAVLEIHNADAFTWGSTDSDTILSTNSQLIVSPHTNTTYYCNLVSMNGCPDTLWHSIRVKTHQIFYDTIDICRSELPINWHDSIIDQNSTSCNKTLNFTTSDGCDSSYTLNLNIHELNWGDTSAVACDSFDWWHSNFTDNVDNATHTFTNAYGCDSVVTLHLTIHHSNSGDTTAMACDSYTWYEHKEIAENTETLTHVFTNTSGCDSVVTLHLTVNHSNTIDTSASECDHFTWHGITYTETPPVAPCIVYTNTDNCDSIVTLNLTIRASTTGTDIQSHCDTYTWIDGNVYTADNNTSTYILAGANASGCDSTAILNLTINHSNTGDTTAIACDSFSWWHTDITESTDLPTHTFTNAAGCDSVVTLHLTVNHSNSAIYSVTACNSYSWHGTTYTESTTTPTHTDQNAAGCDSVTTLFLTINHCSTTDTLAADSLVWGDTTYFTNDTIIEGTDTVIVTICHTVRETIDTAVCNAFTWKGVTYSESVTIIDITTKPDGCDSISTLILTINHCSTTTLTACDSFTWHGVPYNTSGIYTDGTDTLDLTVNYSNSGDTTAEACNSFTWWNMTWYADAPPAEAPTHTYTNVSGCDSVVTLFLTINYSNSGDTTAEACNSFTWWNTTWYAGAPPAEPPTHTYTNVSGCDSVVTLLLTINHCSTTDTLAADSLVWGDTTYFTNDTIIEGTDTIIVTICNTVRDTIDTVACNAFVWQGVTYTASTTVVDTIAKPDGCDSISTLFLTINHCSITTLTVCDSITWHGVLYNTSGIYTDGADTLDLTVNYSNSGDTTVEACNNFTWWNTTWYAGDPPAEPPTHTYTNVSGCDSVVTLFLTINYCSTTDTLAADSLVWGDTTYFTNDTIIEGTDTIIVTICNTVRDTIDTVACNAFVWQGVTYTASTTVVDTIAKPDGCDSISTLLLTINHCSTTDTLAADSLVWGDTTYFTNDTIIEGTDTVIVTICHTVRETIDTAVCNAFTWKGVTYSESVSVIDITTKPDGCDSISTLILTINHCSTTDTLAADSLVWGDTIYYNNDTIITEYDTVIVTICNTVRETIDTTACNAFTWKGVTYSESVTIIDTSTKPDGCDSISTFILTINYCSTTDTLAADSLVWGDTTYFTNDTIIEGTDTIIVTICNTVRDTIDTVACNAFVWQGVTYTASTTVVDTIAKPDGCDSISTLLLTINHCSTTDTLAADSLVWGDTTYFTNDTIIEGTDTVIVTICHTVYSTIDTTVCNMFIWNGVNYYANATIVDTLPRANDCGDSICTIFLTVNPSSTSVSHDTICYNDIYTWHGTTIHSDNNLETEEFRIDDTLSNVFGCDSIVSVIVIKLALPQLSINATPYCRDLTYTVTADVTAPLSPGGEPQQIPWLMWSSVPIDSSLIGYENNASVQVYPHTATRYILTAGYNQTPMCPAQEEIILNPVKPIEAKMKVTPERLGYNNLEFTAYDISHHSDYQRAWLIDWLPQMETEQSLNREVDINDDSVIVALEIFNGQCHDTAVQILPIDKIAIFAPNIFTPERSDNNHFDIITHGVISGELFIYNRDGLLIYHTTDYTQGWDGRDSRSENSPQGNYVWKLIYRAIDRPNDNHVEIGSVLVIH